MPKPFNFDTLGWRDSSRMVETQVQTGETDLGKPVVTIKMMREAFQEESAMLNVEEAQWLEKECGPLTWVEYPGKDCKACLVEHGTSKRRFMLSYEVHAEVYLTDTAAEPEPPRRRGRPPKYDRRSE